MHLSEVLGHLVHNVSTGARSDSVILMNYIQSIELQMLSHVHMLLRSLTKFDSVRRGALVRGACLNCLVLAAESRAGYSSHSTVYFSISSWECIGEHDDDAGGVSLSTAACRVDDTMCF